MAVFSGFTGVITNRQYKQGVSAPAVTPDLRDGDIFSITTTGFGDTPSALSTYMFDFEAQNWVQVINPPATVIQVMYRGTHNIVAGNTTISDSLALVSPFQRLIQFRTSTGDPVDLRIVSEATNSFVVNSPVAITGAIVTSYGVK